MKLNKYLLMFFTFAMIFTGVGISNVKAEKYTGQAIWPSEAISNIYTKRISSNGNIRYQQAKFLRRSEDNKFVYCIQPFVEIDNNYVYNVARSDWWVVANLTQEQWKEATLLAYYGYGYGNHSESKWYAITQLMIWRVVEPNADIYFTDTLNGNRTNKFNNEIAELQSLVDNHSRKPNLTIENNTITMGNTMAITDSNGVLNNFAVSGSNNIEVSKNNNTLYIKGTGVGDATITLSKNPTEYDSEPILYYVDGSQNVFRVGNYDPIRIRLNIKVIGGKLTLHKLDKDKGESIPSGEGNLSGAVYGIYDMADNLITTVVTDDNGNVTSGILPYLSTYKVKEITSSKGYELDNNVYTFTITEDNLYPELTVYEQVIKRQIKIHKYIANGQTGNLQPEENVLFKFYNNKNELVVNANTDENGYATFNLPYGTYTGKQITSQAGLEKVDDFEITINESSPEVINLSFSNAPITAKLKINKVDKETGNLININGIRFRIKDLSTNQYVCQTITYPKAKTICEFETDENGILITPNVLSGDFLIEEIEEQIINGYTWNSEGFTVHIGDGSTFIKDSEFGTLISIDFPNERVKGKIEINKLGEELVIENGTYLYNEILLDDIIFGLYADEDIYVGQTLMYAKNDLIKEIVTESGIASVDNLELGKYYLKELDSKSHILDQTKYNFELVFKDQYTSKVVKSFDLKNYLPKGNLKFTKTDLTTGQVIPNTKIEIYTENDELVFTGITDENGQIEISDLFVGKYYIKEIEPSTSYLISDELVYFEIRENNEVVKANMTNKKITGTLKFKKLELNTDISLSGALIEIYNEDGEIVYHGYTNDDGTIVIENLVYGKYSLKEVEPPKGHELSNEIIYFEIDENGQVIETVLYNNVIVEVPDTFENKDYTIIIISCLLVAIGAGVIFFENKNKRK